MATTFFPDPLSSSLSVSTLGIPGTVLDPGNPLESTFTAEWEALQAKHDADQAAWRRQSLHTIDQAVLDPSKRPPAPTWAANPDSASKRGLVRSYLEVANNALPPEQRLDLSIDGATAVLRDRIADSEFAGAGRGDDLAFFTQLEKSATTRRDRRALLAELDSRARVAAIDSAAGRPGASFAEVLPELRALPGYSPAMDADLLAAWAETTATERASLGPIAPDLLRVWDAVNKGEDIPEDLSLADITASEEMRESTLAAFSSLAKRLPSEQRATILSNLRKTTASYTRRIADSASSSINPFSRKGDIDSAEDLPFDYQSLISPNLPFEEARNIYYRDQRQAADFLADLQDIVETDFDPVKPFAKEGTVLGALERGLYHTPGAALTTATALVPRAGPLITIDMLAKGNYRSMRAEFIHRGLDREAASQAAQSIALPAALIQAPLERLGALGFVNKVPGLSKLTERLTSTLLTRYLARAGTSAAIEFGTELGQDFVPYVLADIAHELNPAFPDTVWENGKDGVLDGYAMKALETFAAVAPLSILMAGGASFRDARVREFARASDQQILATGILPEDLPAIRQAKGVAAQDRVLQEAWTRRDPFSASAKTASDQLLAQHRAAVEAQRAAELQGNQPAILATDQGFTLYDPATGEELGRAADPESATRLFFAAQQDRAEASADEIAFLSSLLEGSRATTTTDQQGEQTRNDLRPEALTQLEAAARDPGAEARILAQQQAREAVGEATPGIGGVVLGEHLTEFKQGVRQMTNRLYLGSGASLLTVFHEDGHRLLKRAQDRGLLPREELIAFGRAWDRIYRDKQTKSGRPLRFLPENDADVTDTMLDEMVAEFRESEILRKRKTGGPYALPARALTTNLAALTRIAAGATRSLKAYIDTFRELFGLASARAYEMRKAIKRGEITEAELDAFHAKLSGLSEQDQLDAEATRHAEELLGPSEADAHIPEEAMAFSLGQGIPPARLEQIREGLATLPSTLRQVRGSDQVKALKPELVGEHFENLATGFRASISGESFRKMLSHSASGRSIDPVAHLQALANLDRLFPLAVALETRPGKKPADTREIAAVHHFIVPMPYRGQVLQARIMAKEFASREQGNRIYLVEALELDAVTPQGITGEVSAPEGIDSPHRPSGVADTFAAMAAIVKNALESGPSFSLASSTLADRLRSDAVSRIADPARRAQAMARIARAMEDARLELERLELLAGGKRLGRSLRKEAAIREALRRDELENETWARHAALLTDDDLVKIRSQPGHAFLADPSNNLKGRLLSKAAAARKHPDLFAHNPSPAEYEGSENVSRTLFGGTLAPDQAAQEMFEAGLVKEASPEAMWTLLESEARHVAGMKTLLESAREELRENRRQAKDETNTWLREAQRVQAETFNPADEIRRTLALLDGILKAVPAEIRGKVGGYTALASLGTNEARLNFLRDRLQRVDKELTAWLRDSYSREFIALLERARPEKDQPGQKPRGKIGASIHDLFATLREAMLWTPGETEAHATALEALVASGELTAEQESHATLEANLVRLTGDWGKADAARREAALIEAQRVYDGAYLAHKAETLRRREKRFSWREALQKATGKSGSRPERKARQKQDQKTKPGRAKASLVSLYSWEQSLQLAFGRDSQEAEFFADWERRASNAKADSIQNKLDQLDDLFATLAGGKLKGEQLRARMGEPDAIKVGDDTFSELEAITATLMWRQEDGQRHMLGHQDDGGNFNGDWHYDQAFIDSIESQLSDQAKALRLHLAEQYAAEYDRLNAVFRDLNGVNLPRHKHYSPLTVAPQQAGSGQIIDPVTGFATAQGFTPGSLKTRSQTAIAEPQFRDALQTYIAHARQMEHWIAYAPFTTEALAVLQARNLRNAVEAKAGQGTVQTLSDWLDYFALGGTRSAEAHQAINTWLAPKLNRAARAALVGRVSVLAIQATQLGAALAEMPAGSYLVRFAKLLSGRLAWGDALASDFIQRRRAQMPALVQQAMDGLRASSPSRLKFAMRKLGETISGADALFTAGTYAITLDYHRTQATRLGLTGQQAETYARNAAERATERVAQPTRPGTRSLVELTATGPSSRILWSFASEARQKFALAAFAFQSNATTAQKVRTLLLTWGIGGAVATLIRAVMRDLRDDGEDDEFFDDKNWDPRLLALQAATGPLQGLPYVGAAIEGTLFHIFGEFLRTGNLLSSTPDAAKTAKNLPDYLEGDVTAEEALRDADLIMQGLAPWSDSAAAAASTLHILRDLYGITDNLIPD